MERTSGEVFFESPAVGVLGFLRIERLVFPKKDSDIDCKLEDCSQNVGGKRGRQNRAGSYPAEECVTCDSEKRGGAEGINRRPQRMGCKGLLSKPWSLRSEATLREFLFERGNQWFEL